MEQHDAPPTHTPRKATPRHLHVSNPQNCKPENRKTKPRHPPRDHIHGHVSHTGNHLPSQNYSQSRLLPPNVHQHLLPPRTSEGAHTRRARHQRSDKDSRSHDGAPRSRTHAKPGQLAQPTRGRRNGHAPKRSPPRHDQKNGAMVQRHISTVHTRTDRHVLPQRVNTNVENRAVPQHTFPTNTITIYHNSSSITTLTKTNYTLQPPTTTPAVKPCRNTFTTTTVPRFTTPQRTHNHGIITRDTQSAAGTHSPTLLRINRPTLLTNRLGITPKTISDHFHKSARRH